VLGKKKRSEWWKRRVRPRPKPIRAWPISLTNILISLNYHSRGRCLKHSGRSMIGSLNSWAMYPYPRWHLIWFDNISLNKLNWVRQMYLIGTERIYSQCGIGVWHAWLAERSRCGNQETSTRQRATIHTTDQGFLKILAVAKRDERISLTATFKREPVGVRSSGGYGLKTSILIGEKFSLAPERVETIAYSINGCRWAMSYIRTYGGDGTTVRLKTSPMCSFQRATLLRTAVQDSQEVHEGAL